MKKDNKTKVTMDNLNPTPLTEAQQAELAALTSMRDDEIDFSDIPASTKEEWKDAVRGRFYKPIKQQMTVRIDADVLAWLKAQGRGYQTRMNTILRAAMMHSLHEKDDVEAEKEHALVR